MVEKIAIATLQKRLEKAMRQVPLTIEDWGKILPIICPEDYSGNELKLPRPAYKQTRNDKHYSDKKSYRFAQFKTCIGEDEIIEMEE